MSIILDALKKAESERKSTQDNPELPSLVTRSSPLKRKVSPVLVAALLVAAGLAGSGAFIASKKFLGHAGRTETPKALPPAPVVTPKDDTTEKLARLKQEADQLLAAGNLPECRKHWEDIVKLSPDAESYNNLGVILRRMEDNAGAETAYQKAIELKPEYPEALNNLGALYLANQESEDESLRLFKKAAGLNSQYAEPHFHLGVLLERRGLNRQAADQYQQFLTLSTAADDALKEKLGERIKKLKAGD